MICKFFFLSSSSAKVIGRGGFFFVSFSFIELFMLCSGPTFRCGERKDALLTIPSRLERECRKSSRRPRSRDRRNRKRVFFDRWPARCLLIDQSNRLCCCSLFPSPRAARSPRRVPIRVPARTCALIASTRSIFGGDGMKGEKEEKKKKQWKKREERE